MKSLQEIERDKLRMEVLMLEHQCTMYVQEKRFDRAAELAEIARKKRSRINKITIERMLAELE